jgi:alpha-L-fucosidase
MTKGETLYLFALGWPADGKLKVKTLAKGNSVYPRAIGAVAMLGVQGRLKAVQNADALEIELPARPVGHLDAFGFRVLA